MKAAHAGQSDALRALVLAGASPNASNRRGTTPLMYAFSRFLSVGDDSAFRTLLDLGADHESRDQHGRSLAEYAPLDKLPLLRSLFPGIF